MYDNPIVIEDDSVFKEDSEEDPSEHFYGSEEHMSVGSDDDSN